MLVTARMDRMGNVYVRPVADRWAKRFAKHVEKMGGGYSLDVFFQEGMGASQFMDELTPAQRKDIEGGYTIRFRVEGWMVGMWYGYDASEIVTREMA